ncbi:HupE/UreJ family protein [Streptomyces sp. NPDC050263]|uniref:HupE/UreJ family protein n=1 Tax=Streptomyces sp. NPDC050263 TaxID=3155037 RepID=UPI00341DF20F
MFRLGASHILEGTDHLLFLLFLLLPAPLCAIGNRRRGLVNARTAVKRIARTTLAHPRAFHRAGPERLRTPNKKPQLTLEWRRLMGC